MPIKTTILTEILFSLAANNMIDWPATDDPKKALSQLRKRGFTQTENLSALALAVRQPRLIHPEEIVIFMQAIRHGMIPDGLNRQVESQYDHSFLRQHGVSIHQDKIPEIVRRIKGLDQQPGTLVNDQTRASDLQSDTCMEESEKSKALSLIIDEVICLRDQLQQVLASHLAILSAYAGQIDEGELKAKLALVIAGWRNIFSAEDMARLGTDIYLWHRYKSLVTHWRGETDFICKRLLKPDVNPAEIIVACEAIKKESAPFKDKILDVLRHGFYLLELEKHSEKYRGDFQSHLDASLHYLRTVFARYNLVFQTQTTDVNGFVELHDIQLVGKILEGLLTNAFQASPKDSIPIVVIRCEKNAGASHLYLGVVNEGAPIPDEVKAGMLSTDRFTSGKKYGTGIGLMVVKEYLKQTQGWMAVESRNGKNEVGAFISLKQLDTSLVRQPNHDLQAWMQRHHPAAAKLLARHHLPFLSEARVKAIKKSVTSGEFYRMRTIASRAQSFGWRRVSR